MKKLVLALGLSVFGLSAGMTSAQAADGSVEGYWLTQNERSVIHIQPCDEGVCGKIHWIIDGGLQFDEKNPDETKRNTPMCGLKILWGFEQDEPGKMDDWEDGKIYKADEGDTYDADIKLKEDGTLKLRGYVGVSLFGKTQIWNRVEAKDYKKCVPAT